MREILGPFPSRTTEAIELVDDLFGSLYGTNRVDVTRSLILYHLKKLADEKMIELRLAKAE